MKQIFIAALKWFVLLVGVDLTSSLVHQDLIRITGPIFALFMLIKLLPQYVKKPFWGLVFSLVVVFISGISATGLISSVICECYPNVAVCLPNLIRAAYFGFFAFPALIIVPWAAMAIGKFSKTWIR